MIHDNESETSYETPEIKGQIPAMQGYEYVAKQLGHRVHIRHSRPTGILVSLLQRVPFGRTQKEPKGPRPIVRPSLRSGSLAPDLLRGHAATGHPWPRRGSPGIHAGRPTPQHLLSASREGWQIKNTAPRGGRPAGLFGSRVLRNLCRYSVAGSLPQLQCSCSSSLRSSAATGAVTPSLKQPNPYGRCSRPGPV